MDTNNHISRPLRKGDRLSWIPAPQHSIVVRRVAKDQSWADIFVYDNRTRTSWTKRQPLPLHESFVVKP